MMPLYSDAGDICEGWRRSEYEVVVDVHLSTEVNRDRKTFPRLDKALEEEEGVLQTTDHHLINDRQSSFSWHLEAI